MLNIFVITIFIILFLFFVVFLIIISLGRILSLFFRKGSFKQTTRTRAKKQSKAKVFDDDEGVYVDYEEVNDSDQK